MNIYDDTFTHLGYQFRVTARHDDAAEAPWDGEDGHGPVSGWAARDKRPGERVLCQSHGPRRYYDIEGATALAKKDDWGLSVPKLRALAAELGREPTRGEVAAAAVEADYDYLKAWCDNQWEYVVAHVELLDVDGAPVDDFDEYLGGVQAGYSDEDAYHAELVHDMANAVIARLPDGDTTTQLSRDPVRLR